MTPNAVSVWLEVMRGMKREDLANSEMFGPIKADLDCIDAKGVTTVSGHKSSEDA